MNIPHDEARNERHLSKVCLEEMLLRLFRIRRFEERAAQLRAQYIPGPLHNSVGQEAAIVGACMALRDNDYMTGTHRSHGHPIGKGIGLATLMAELFGKRTGVCRGKGGSMHLAAFGAGSLGESGIVGASMPTATGAGLSAILRGTDQVCLCFFGDGAANCGPFHESLNLAAVWSLPVIFFCENNGYAICTPQGQTTAVVDVASRSASYGIPGVRVDGQDVLAVHEAVSLAVERARRGKGPTLVEARTYRYCDHQEDFQFPPHRVPTEIEHWRKRDPIRLFVDKLQGAGVLTEDEVIAIEERVSEEVNSAVQFAQDSPAPEQSELMEDLFR